MARTARWSPKRTFDRRGDGRFVGGAASNSITLVNRFCHILTYDLHVNCSLLGHSLAWTVAEYLQIPILHKSNRCTQCWVDLEPTKDKVPPPPACLTVE